MEYMTNYNFALQYPPGKANVMADGLSKKKHVVLICIINRESSIQENVQVLHLNRTMIEDRLRLSALYSVVAQPTLIDKVRKDQKNIEKANAVLVRIAECRFAR